MNIDLSTSEPPFVFQISQSSNIGQKWVCIQNLQMDFSFQEKKTVCNSVAWFTSYINICDQGEFRRFFGNTLKLEKIFTSLLSAKSDLQPTRNFAGSLPV